jgi:(2Fe-2S) ferredoxin
MARIAGGNVWQVSHVGGCRFAPNVICLPGGVVYGRVDSNDCQAILDASRANRVVPRLLRGRSCYDKPAQAAEYFVRSELDETGDLERIRADQVNGQWHVVFRRGGERILLKMTEEITEIFTFKSCAASSRLPRPKIRLVECLVEPTVTLAGTYLGFERGLSDGV